MKVMIALIGATAEMWFLWWVAFYKFPGWNEVKDTFGETTQPEGSGTARQESVMQLRDEGKQWREKILWRHYGTNRPNHWCNWLRCL